MFKIGEITIPNKTVLAPMAGVSNAAYRAIAREFGAGLTFAEMVSDKGLLHGNKKTKALLVNFPNEHPYAQQIFGAEIESLLKAALYVDQHTNADIIDLNMGCPVPKVSLRSQAGAFLLKSPEKIYEIVKTLKSEVKKPLTVKIRSGWDESSINADLVAKAIEKGGADAITIHARTRAQLYRGKADLEIIKKVKAAVSIPVIGNGDIDSGRSAKKMLDETGCDAVMVGRKALGNPWIFKEINTYLKTGTILKAPSLKERKNVILKHYHYLEELKGEKIATLEMRAGFIYYLKGLTNTKETKQKISQMQTRADFYQIIASYFKEI
ncbi:MAG TPA: tRNA dihydrouridine synthase DusB [Acholeplasmataceae bacterium]|nr:tRNA dihydrouridine synthase DusB [Acholeplasmataceae bacterium]